MTKQQFIDWAKSKGWVPDKYGHLQRNNKEPSKELLKEYRFKISNTSFRYEIKVHFEGGQYSGPKSKWVWIGDGYFKDLSITPEGKLHGMR